jgi:hypothetical protein
MNSLLSLIRYTVIGMSVVFLLATSVTAAVSPNEAPFNSMQRSTTEGTPPEPVSEDTSPQRAPMPPQPQMSGPTFSEGVMPSVSAPVGSLPTAVPPDPDKPAAEMNPRQKPTDAQTQE